jgi:hypothetical protein
MTHLVDAPIIGSDVSGLPIHDRVRDVAAGARRSTRLRQHPPGAVAHRGEGAPPIVHAARGGRGPAGAPAP